MGTNTSGTIIEDPDGRRRLTTESPWEHRMGYCRAIQAGPMIWVSGCVGIHDDGTYPKGLTAQTQRCIQRISEALESFGAGLKDVVKVRIYTTDIDRWEEIAEIMGPTFQDHRPTNLLIEVSKLVDGAVVEIEAEAYLMPDSKTIEE